MLLPSLQALLLGCAALGSSGGGPAAIQAGLPKGEVELPAVDPYTRGEAAALERAGYVSLGPFPWCDEIATPQLERALEEPRILWLETKHFRLGSTLASYKSGGDRIENRRLDADLERLGRKLGRLQRDAARLDPWLRLHLLAQRCEEQLAEFRTRFGLRVEDDRDTGGCLGLGSKFTVLVTERNATLARFLESVAHQPVATHWSGELPGGSLFVGQSAQGLREQGYVLDAALQCVLAADLALNFVKGYGGYHESTPIWFGCGLSHWFSRRVDERWTIYAAGTLLNLGDDAWDWPPRVRRMFRNNEGATWSDMLDWPDWNAIDARGHLLAWSRVDWLLARKEADLRALLQGLAGERPTHAQQEQLLAKCFGAGLTELDARWREFVLHGSPNK